MQICRDRRQFHAKQPEEMFDASPHRIESFQVPHVANMLAHIGVFVLGYTKR